MKRRQGYSSNTRPYKKRRTVPVAQQPKRTYPGSRVPLASRGYTPNTVERKAWDIGGATAGTGAIQTKPVSTTMVVEPIFLPTLGTDMVNRIGRKTMIKSIQVRGYMYPEAAKGMAVSAIPIQDAFVMLLWDTQPNGAAPGVLDILNTTSPASMLNLNNRDRFKVIKRKHLVFDAFAYNSNATLSLAGFNRTIQPIEIYVKCNLETIFNSVNGGTIADINTGALYFVTYGSEATGANTDLQITWTSRVRFLDS